jgi:hypothetical protein
VDEKGRFSDYGSTRLIDWLTHKQVETVVEKKLSGLSSEIDKSITEAVNNGIKKNVSDKFAEMVIRTARENNLALENKSS